MKEFLLDCLRLVLLSTIIYCSYRIGYVVGNTEQRLRVSRQELGEMIYNYGVKAGCQNELGICHQ